MVDRTHKSTGRLGPAPTTTRRPLRDDRNNETRPLPKTTTRIVTVPALGAADHKYCERAVRIEAVSLATADESTVVGARLFLANDDHRRHKKRNKRTERKTNYAAVTAAEVEAVMLYGRSQAHDGPVPAREDYSKEK